MGYSVTVEEYDPSPVLKAERLHKVWAILEDTERVHGHISWCQPLDEYHGTMPQRIAAVFRDYGFEWADHLDGNVTINGWEGDKIGSCWDAMLTAICTGLDDQEIRWLVVGEDGEQQAITLTDTGVQHGTVTIKWHTNTPQPCPYGCGQQGYDCNH